jgi:hypothetical protein
MSDVTIKQFIIWSGYGDSEITKSHRVVSNLLRDFIVPAAPSEVSEYFYPKNLFISNDTEAYIFGGNSIQKVFIDGNNGVIKTFRYDQITKVELIRPFNDTNLRLNVEFATGDNMVMDNVADTNYSYREQFKNKIVEINRLLINGAKGQRIENSQ